MGPATLPAEGTDRERWDRSEHPTFAAVLALFRVAASASRNRGYSRETIIVIHGGVRWLLARREHVLLDLVFYRSTPIGLKIPISVCNDQNAPNN